MLKKTWFLLNVWFYSALVFAVPPPPPGAAHAKTYIVTTSQESQGFGDIAQNLFGAAMNVRQMVQLLCIACGAILIIFGFIQYAKHRKNPVQTTFSTVFMTFLIGLILIAIAFIPMNV